MEDFDEKEIAELVDKFKQMVNSGNSLCFDSDEMEIIIDELMSNYNFTYASKAIDYAIKLYPSEYFFRILRVKQLILEVKIEQAQKELDDIENLFPPSAEFYLEKVLLSRITGEEENAFDLLQKALEIDPDEPEVHFLLAYEYIKRKKIATAIKHATYAMKIDEEFDEQLFTYSYLFEDNKQYEDAISFFAALTDNFPLHKGTWFGLGLANSWLGEHEKAIEAYNYVLTVDESVSTAHFNMANSYYELRDYDNAMKHYQESYFIDNQDVSAITSIGDCYSCKNDYTAAMSFYRDALEINPNHLDAIMGIISILRISDKADEAKEFIEKAFSLNPQSFDLLFAVADFYNPDEQLDILKNLFQRTLEQTEEVDDLFRYFTIYCCSNERYELGLELIRHYADNVDIAGTFPYYMAALHYLSGNIKAGNSYLEDALVINYEEYEHFLTLDPLLESFSEITDLIERYRS